MNAIEPLRERLLEWWQRIRSNLFAIPAIFVIAGVVLGVIANVLDQRVGPEGVDYLLPATLAGGRAVLSTVAGATITVAALVFSITAVTVQLASSQYSPRVLQGFLQDPFHRVVIGVVTGTFTFALVSLSTVGRRADVPESSVAAAWATTLGTVFGIASIVAIVAFIDHVIRRIRVDDMIRRLTRSTAAGMRHAFEAQEEGSDPIDEPIPTGGEKYVIRSEESGWVRNLRPRRLVGLLPPGSVARLDIGVGDHVSEGDRLVTVWSEGDGGPVDVSSSWVEIGSTRILANDPGFGIRQLVDVALRALSPGINDPATAADVLRHLVEPLRIALAGPDRSQVIRDDRGVRLLMPLVPDQADYVRAAFSEIRLAAAGQLLVVKAFVEAIGSLLEYLGEQGAGHREAPLRQQLRLMLEDIEERGMRAEDKRNLDRSLRRYGFEWPEPEASGGV